MTRFVQEQHEWIKFDDTGFPDATTILDDDDFKKKEYFPLAIRLYYLAAVSVKSPNADSIKEQIKQEVAKTNVGLDPEDSQAFNQAVRRDIEELSKPEIRELVWKQEHPQLEERLEDIFDEAEDYLPRFMHACGIDPRVHVHTVRLMETLDQVAFAVAMHFKLAFKRARPSQLNRKLYPSILVPAHHSFPSGHSTQANLIALALNAVFADTNFSTLAAHLDQVALDVAENREWAGVHYATDTQLGKDLAEEIWTRGVDNSTVFTKLLEDAAGEWR